MSDVDAILTHFLEECFSAGPKLCPLAREGATVQSTETAIYDLLEKLKTISVPLPHEFVSYNFTSSGRAVDHDGLRGLIHLTMYHPNSFPLMAAGLDGLLNTGDFEAFAAWRDVEAGRAAGTAQSDSQIGIRCGDKNPDILGGGVGGFDSVKGMVERADGVSKIGGVGSFFWNCAHWGIEAKETYKGDFRAKTKNPILMVSASWDPVTPLVSAHNASEAFEGSVVLEREGFGVSFSPTVC